MSVLGLDIGNDNCVIAVAKQRGIDVLLNDESNRETPAVVSFGEKQRFLGSSGVACATMNPKSTISQLKRLIGRCFDEPDVQDDLKSFPFETSKGPNGGVLIHLLYMGERHTFTPVQIMAMLFSHLRKTAEKDLETQVSDCVIGIPSYFTDLQRQLYLDSALIAGIKPLRLMHDSTATALGYGIYKTDLSKSSPNLVVFVDIGHSDTQVSVVLFKPGHMKTLSHAFDNNLGGRDFDKILFSYFAAQFKEQYSIDVYANTRACIRLRAACDKLKKVLSANPEAPLHIECLMDEKDVKGFIKRDEFEKLSSSLFDRLSSPCQKALIDARVTTDKIQSVELVGSGSRIPAIGRLLASIFGKEARRTLNASECVARGCALHCAMLSPSFRVKEYEVEDSLPFSIGFQTNDAGPTEASQSQELFHKGQSIPSVKMLTLRERGTFQMEVFYANQNELPPGVSPRISCFTIGPYEVPRLEHAKVKVKACITLNGTVTLESAFLVGTHMDETAAQNDSEMAAETMDVESDHGFHEARKDVEDRYSPKPYINNRKGNIRFELPINEVVYGGMSQDELVEANEKEIKLVNQDIEVEQAKEKKNTLEAYVYETRNKILNTFQAFATDSEKEGIIKRLQQTEDWLYEDGDNETANVYNERLEDLKKLVDPIENRYKDEDARPQQANNLLNSISSYKNEARKVTDTRRDAVLNECTKTEKWLREKMQEQESQPKNVDPVVWSTDIKREAETLLARCEHIARSKGSPPRSDNEAYL